MKFLVLICSLGFSGLWAQTAAQTAGECAKLRYHGKLAEAQACYTKLTASRDPAVRAEGFWGIDNYKSANDEFRAAVARAPKDPNVRVRWGRLLLERFNPDDASGLFKEALTIDKDNAQALLGAALVASEGFESAAVQLSEKAIEADPKLVDAYELLAKLALEDSNNAKALEYADKAIAISPEALDAMAIHASVRLLTDKDAQPWFERISKVNPVYGEAHAIAGHFYVLNRRYEEGIAEFRKALELSPRLWPARSELGINLMRMGSDVEAREQLELCFNNGFANQPTKNSLRLLDSYKNFVTYKRDRFILRLHKKEAELLEPYFSREMEKVLAAYDKKYKVKLPGPVQVEVYPDHEDFAVRTMGMPGLGALGVTFGTYIAMDSPSGRKPGTFHWASTLWHEMSHVYVLTATHHRVPRWFTEGMAVHEETASSPDWGDRLDPTTIKAIEDKKLLPVAELDRGFVRQAYPGQVMVSYFEAGKICDFINEKYGYQKLLDMMNDFAAAPTTAAVVEKELGMKPEDFDKLFLSWLHVRTDKQVQGFAEWRKKLRAMAVLAKDKKYDETIAEGNGIVDTYADYVEAGSVYEFLADAYAGKNDKKNEAAILTRYSEVGGRNPTLLKRLAAVDVELGNKKDAIRALERINYVYLSDEEQHRTLGNLYMDLKEPGEAISEFQAVIALKPLDQAGAHFRLAEAYRGAARLDNAKEELLYALEAAPGFRPAQRMLLELSSKN